MHTMNSAMNGGNYFIGLKCIPLVAYKKVVSVGGGELSLQTLSSVGQALHCSVQYLSIIMN